MNTPLLILMLGAMPFNLSSDLLTETHTVYKSGYHTSATLAQVQEAWRRGQEDYFQVSTIHSEHPRLAWELPEGITRQAAYRILVASKAELLAEGKTDVWDSGDVESSQTSGIVCGGKALQAGTIYYWTVRVTGPDGASSDYARPQQFLTARKLDDQFPRSPLRKTRQKPTSVNKRSEGLWMVDFGKAAYGQLELTVESPTDDTLTIRLGEAQQGGRVNQKPGGSIRYTQYQLPVHKGLDTYQLIFRPDGRNAMIKPEGADVRPVLMPDYIGEVYPFRYVEVESHLANLKQAERQMVHYAWDDEASYFHSSDSVLNQVWDLCRYSIKATTFAGVYVDGDRERIPYEADAIINQLGHYCTDREYTMARYTTDYLCHNATWPTEWILQAVLLAWNDYLYTGDPALIERDYDVLKARTLLALQDSTGLISTRTKKQAPELLKACGYYGKQIRDIVDWPQSGAFGIGKEEPGEADGYVFEDYNTVVNAYHYEALRLMSLIAEALGRKDDIALYAQKAEKVKEVVNNLLFDKKNGWYLDGLTTPHHALHASMFPLAFDMVPPKQVPTVLRHIQSRGMACSVYGAQFLLEALYRGGLDDYALKLLTATDSRSWYNMIRNGSTITWEAWDTQFKPNLDWNHAWGAAPANIIPRWLMGIRPLEPGWSRMIIHPQPGNLSYADIRIPTIRGYASASFRRENGEFILQVHIPAGTTAKVVLPCGRTKERVKELTAGDHELRVKDTHA
ncbi:MAG: family 78 glycoside hydrolase catalytic domain [Bacteroidaceae bacterium]|nr:family 78 glycoside hydrolase catalytic domain [Bacteroidaceae bacterium]